MSYTTWFSAVLLVVGFVVAIASITAVISEARKGRRQPTSRITA